MPWAGAVPGLWPALGRSPRLWRFFHRAPCWWRWQWGQRHSNAPGAGCSAGGPGRLAAGSRLASRWHGGVTTSSSMQSTGQAGMHSSQPVQCSATTVCMNFLAPKMASTGQALMHRVQPMHQASSMRATVSGPSMPNCGFRGCAGWPVSAAKRCTPSCPPGGHWLMGASPRQWRGRSWRNRGSRSACTGFAAGLGQSKKPARIRLAWWRKLQSWPPSLALDAALWLSAWLYARFLCVFRPAGHSPRWRGPRAWPGRRLWALLWLLLLWAGQESAP